MPLPHSSITPLPNNEPDAVPSLWNTRYEEIDANFNNLDGRQELSEADLLKARGEFPALGDRIDSIAQALGDLTGDVGGLQATTAPMVSRAVNLDWLYRGNAINFELFVSGYTLIDSLAVAVIQGVSGDDSIDVASTADLKAGEYYVLYDRTNVGSGEGGIGGGAAVPVLVQIVSILSSTRVRLAGNLTAGWTSTAFLARSSFNTVTGAGSLVPGDIYLSKAITIGDDAIGGAVVIRRSLNAGLARLYYRDAYQKTWKETGWSMRRTGGTIPAGFADYEYILPMRGEGWLRLDASGEAFVTQHIIALGTATGLGGFINPDLRPNTPAISSPVAAATAVMARPTLAISGYSSPASVAQAAVQFQISTDAAFATVLHDSGALGSGLSYPMPDGVLAVNVAYKLRARVQDVAGLWSDWSVVTTFTTAASFAYVAAPSITGPANNATDIPEQPTLSCSAFAMVGGTDTHSASQFQVRAAAGSYTAPVFDSGTDTVNKLSIVVPAGKLLAGQSVYYARVRQQGATKGFGEWSTEVKFTTKSAFATIIGLALLTTGGGSGTWSRIDENGAAKVTDAAFFSSHQTYGQIQDVTIDSQAMVKIPAFYVKSAAIASGVNAGKRAWWISDQPAAGFVLHPAFMEAGAPIAQFWVGKYQGTTDSAKLGSKAGLTPLVSIDFPTMQARATARNVSGVTGFALWNYYQLEAIQLLCAIEMGGADSQALIGQGNVSTSAVQAVDSTTVAQATWRGIVGLWGNVWQMVDGLQTDASSKFKIWDKSGNKSYITTNQTAPASGTYPVTFSTDSGANHDLSVSFLPATGDATAGNGSTGDIFYQNPNCVAYHGGYYGYGSSAGLFNLSVLYASSYSSTNIGGRLAKV
ncbi:hypothetical protein [Pseudomonas sp. UMAB-08]|uniref:hypothetical protein n=1 Tax=Pseudomonas sp. UMAB-08 TaxID=1365375 RepID=UPI001C56BED0|nr:hypothetical protein [Pseudomonas sp. UMAB-08]